MIFLRKRVLCTYKASVTLPSDCLLVASLTLLTFFFIYSIPEDSEDLYYNSELRKQQSNDTIYDYSIKEWRKFRNYEIGIIHELMKRVLGPINAPNIYL